MKYIICIYNVRKCESDSELAVKQDLWQYTNILCNFCLHSRNFFTN